MSALAGVRTATTRAILTGPRHALESNILKSLPRFCEGDNPRKEVIIISVLKQKRLESSAEFINTARIITTETLNFLTRLSARYSRLLAEPTAKEAINLLVYCEKANAVFMTDDIRKELRERYLLEAKSSLAALDNLLSLCYDVMLTNPAGCYTKSNGDPMPGNRASAKLDKMAQKIGSLIDKETKLLTGVLKSDKK